ncbi:MAG TPA: hypothetical protein VIV11_32355 [Kofleriaceae bacterium]
MRWLVVAALCVGCKSKKAPPKFDDAPPAPADAAVADAPADAATPDAATMPLTITPDGVGPITAKHIDEDDYKELLVGLTIKSEHREGEDFRFDEYVASKGTTPVLRAVISDRSLFKIEVMDPMFTTVAGIGVGMTAEELAAKTPGLKCVYETYDPNQDAERVDRALHCGTEKLPRVRFEIDHDKFKGPEGKVNPKVIAKRKIVQIVWLAPEE